MPSAIDNIPIITDISPNTHSRRASLKILNRNIQQVVLGDLVFDTWYYSPYPDAIILGSNRHSVGRHGAGNIEAKHTNGLGGYPFVLKDEPACPRLYVCPYCFCYSPSEDSYVSHLYHHERLNQDGNELKPVPETAFKVYEWDGYTVWEVDGETEKLYCQNLSLFGKLFLEQKSVFFDTAGFKYYVLTHTRPQPPQSPSRKGRIRKRGSSLTSPGHHQTQDNDDHQFSFGTQVVGFFSKENLSWDSNNLACILIFPPFQRRQLGQLLMAVSYKLSGWEWEGGIIGGPEKPLSTMGRKSYLRFWSERIARFTMGQTADADGERVFDKVRKKKRRRRRQQQQLQNNHHHQHQDQQQHQQQRQKPLSQLVKEEMTIKEIGDRTGMLPEDVVAALTEMGVCEVKARRKYNKKKQKSGSESAVQETTRNGINTSTNAMSTDAATTNHVSVGKGSCIENAGDQQQPPLATMTILRSKIVAWAESNQVDMIGPVKEEGFLGEWALSDGLEEEEEEDDGEEGEGQRDSDRSSADESEG